MRSLTFAPQVLEVEVPARVGPDLLELVPGHRHAGGVRPVRGVGRDDRVALLAAIGEVRAHEHEPGQLALRSCGRLERHRREPRDLREDLLQPPHELERALRGLVLLVRVQVAETREPGQPLVHARVVLHRARAERVEARVHAERAVGERREMADELGLGDLGQTRRMRPAQALRDLRNRQIGPRRSARAATRPGPLEDELGVGPGAARLLARSSAHLLEHRGQMVDVLDRLLLRQRDQQHVVHALVVAAEGVARVDPVLARAPDDLAGRDRRPERDLLERLCVEGRLERDALARVLRRARGRSPPPPGARPARATTASRGRRTRAASGSS